MITFYGKRMGYHFLDYVIWYYTRLCLASQLTLTLLLDLTEQPAML